MKVFGKTIIVLSLLIILSSFVCGAVSTNDTLIPFVVSVAPVKDRIDFEENAIFKITIYNPRDTIEPFSIKSSAPYVEWFVKTDPISDYNVKVYPKSIKEVTLIAKPLSVGLGRYALRINIQNTQTKELFQKDILINVASMSNIPAIGISGKMPEEVDPREPFVVTAQLENKNAKNLQNVTVILKSDIIYESTQTSLGPIGSLDGTKTLEFTVKIDKKTAPINSDSLRVIVNIKEGDDIYELKSIPYRYKVLQYGGLVDQHDTKFKLFGKYDSISFVNDANVKFDGVARLENPLYRALFTRENPRAFTFVENGKRYMGWNISLKSQEKFDVTVSVNYLPLVVLIVSLLIIIIAYYALRSPVIITKSVRDISTKDGGITRFKIVLHVRNRAKKGVENLAIIDKIPDIADYEHEAEAGTLEPVKVVRTKQGVIAKWMINFLGSKEENVITYKIKSRLSVLGGMSLPIALSKFYDKKGIPKRSYSNKLKIKV